MSAPTKADVLIVGGGIMGASAAFFLARRGRSVILLERERIGRQASGVNYGNVRRQGRPLNQLPLSNRAREIWRDLPTLIGEDCEFLPRGHLRIALDQDSVEELSRYADEARPAGLDLDVMNGNRARALFPWLSHRILAASLSPLDGHANPRLAAPAFGRAAARAGAMIREGVAVSVVTKAGEDFLVETAQGETFAAPALLLCAGAWSGPFAAAFGEAAPLEVRGPQLSVTEPLPYFIAPSTSIASKSRDDHVYFRQITRGNVVIGGPRHGPASAETARANVLPENLLIQMETLRSLAPALANARIIRSWSGVECYTPDAQPVMGPSPSVAGLYYAYGFSGAGFQIGPAVGETMAELIDRARAPVSLEDFSPRRFAGRTT